MADIDMLKRYSLFLLLNFLTLVCLFAQEDKLEQKIQQLKSERVGQRATAAMSLSNMKREEAVPYLIEALDDPQASVRKQAARAIGEILQKGTVSILTEEGIKTHTAPYSGITKAGTKRVIWHHDEVVITTVQRTNERDLEKIEADVMAKDFVAIGFHPTYFFCSSRPLVCFFIC